VQILEGELWRFVICGRCGGPQEQRRGADGDAYSAKCACTSFSMEGLISGADGPLVHAAIDRSKFRSSRCRLFAKGQTRIPTVFPGLDPQTMFRVVWKADGLYIFWILDPERPRYDIARVEQHADSFEIIIQATCSTFEAAYELAFDRPFGGRANV
jgi:hypothetical protein